MEDTASSYITMRMVDELFTLWFFSVPRLITFEYSISQTCVGQLYAKKKKKGLEKYEHDIHSAASLFRAPN